MCCCVRYLVCTQHSYSELRVNKDLSGKLNLWRCLVPCIRYHQHKSVDNILRVQLDLRRPQGTSNARILTFINHMESLINSKARVAMAVTADCFMMI